MVTMVCKCTGKECKQCKDERGLCRTSKGLYMVTGYQYCPWTMKNIKVEVVHKEKKK